MKHLIVINPASGANKDIDKILAYIHKSFEGLDYDIHITNAPREVVDYLKNYLERHKDEEVRVYAFGGDGTIHEVVNGIVGYPNVSLAIYADGTGNDFVKIYGGADKFLDVTKSINGQTIDIDISRVSSPALGSDWYSINVINFGFDAIVGSMGNYYKEHGIPSDAKRNEKNDPYTYALNHDAMKYGRFNDTIVIANGEKLNDKQLLLGTIAQGKYVGGKFLCAPKSDNTDGLLDVCVLKTMSFLSLGLIIGPYTKGKHLNKPNKKIAYRQVKRVEIIAPKAIDVCVDGEMIKGARFVVEVMPKAIKLVIPE